MPNKLLAQISRDFFAKHRVYRYKMIKVKEMDDQAVIRYCHWYCEENKLTSEFKKYREDIESEYVYCSYLQDYISLGLCYDMQMIRGGYIKQSVLPDIHIDNENLDKCCVDCKNQL
ncbi:MAG: hypothetical protein E7635_06785 [Ruminococcaceae bacterium]|nr:hypothetical protein [Oscillospiraceae bacterium]